MLLDLNFLLQNVHICSISFWWTFECSIILLFAAKLLLQKRHVYGFSPVCILKCFFISLLVENFFPQNSHMRCLLKCSLLFLWMFNSPLVLNFSMQGLHSKANPSGLRLKICLVNVHLVKKVKLHTAHLCFFSPWYCMFVVRSDILLKVVWQMSQQNLCLSEWTSLCLFFQPFFTKLACIWSLAAFRIRESIHVCHSKNWGLQGTVSVFPSRAEWIALENVSLILTELLSRDTRYWLRVFLNT